MSDRRSDDSAWQTVLQALEATARASTRNDRNCRSLRNMADRIELATSAVTVRFLLVTA